MRKGQLFLDVGSNIGFYTVQVAHKLRESGHDGCFVHSFEPVGSNCVRQRANYQINDLNSCCLLHEHGLSDSESRLQISLREDFNSGSSTGNAAIVTSQQFDEGFEVMEIPVKTLDSVCAKSFSGADIGVVKIDVEGHEDFVLRGGRNMFASSRPIVFMELNKLKFSLIPTLVGFEPKNVRMA